MGNMIDYIRWRGDLTFQQDPFNEVDALVLCQLIYTDFSGVVSGNPDECVSLRDARDRFFEMHTDEEIRNSAVFGAEAPYLMNDLVKSRRFGDMRLSAYVNHVSDNIEAQMAAVTCILSDGSIFAAFRGTDDTLVGWKEDLNLAFLDETGGQRLSAIYLERKVRRIAENLGIISTGRVQDIRQRLGDRIYKGVSDRVIRLGGHSKGGNFAIYAAGHVDIEMWKHVSGIYAMDSPGFKKEVTERSAYKRVVSRVESVSPAGSIVGVLLDHSYQDRQHLILSSGKGVGEHDAMTWQIEGNHFQETKSRRIGSRLFGETIDRFVKPLPDEDRRFWVDGIYNIISGSGARTLTDFRSKPGRRISGMMHAVRSMPRQGKKKLKSMTRELLRTRMNLVNKTRKRYRAFRRREKAGK